MQKSKKMLRPAYAYEVADFSESLEEFGYNLRDWQHELKKVSSRKEFKSRICQAPLLMKEKFSKGEIADAYLAAYTIYLCECSNVSCPKWTYGSERVSQMPWFSHDDRNRLLIRTPVAFRERNIFAEPENVLRIRSGRPRVSQAHKRKVNALRQKRYREKVKNELEHYRKLYGGG
jgi:hypothetical protein